jgi:hypothetical protein
MNRLHARTRRLAFCILASLLTACGGGGDQAGTCGFGSSCQPSSSGGTGGTPGPVTFFQSGVGDSVFTLPAGVEFVQIQARVQANSQNFVLRLDGGLLINTIIGQSAFPTSVAGTYAVRGRRGVAITNAQGVAWTVVATQLAAAPTGATFSLSGQGDSVFLLPPRAANYRITASFPGPGSNFVVYADRRLVINTIVGTRQSPATADGTYALPAGALVEVVDAPGVSWQVTLR